MDMLERRRHLLDTAMGVETKLVLEHVPDSGRFSPVYVRMVEYAKHDGFLYVEHSAAHGCAIRASVNPKGTDLEISNYVFFGSRQDCIDWLKDKAHLDELLKIYDHLIQKADDKM